MNFSHYKFSWINPKTKDPATMNIDCGPFPNVINEKIAQGFAAVVSKELGVPVDLYSSGYVTAEPQRITGT